MSSRSPLAPSLTRPRRHEGVVVHDATFEAWDHSFGVMRDVVNHGVDALNHAGAGLPHLPRGSLQELLVLPLSGDYGAIRGNAEACHEVGRALARWSDDLAGLGLGVLQGWSGASAAAYLARSTELVVSVEVASRLVEVGAGALDRIATRCERFGVRVEELVVDLGRSLSRLVRRLLARVGGPAGWALFAAELVTEGLSAVTDIVDDVRRVVGLVETLLALRETIRDWARSTRDDLDLLLDLGRLVG
jgi:hypothetical protein